MGAESGRDQPGGDLSSSSLQLEGEHLPLRNRLSEAFLLLPEEQAQIEVLEALRMTFESPDQVLVLGNSDGELRCRFQSEGRPPREQQVSVDSEFWPLVLRQPLTCNNRYELPGIEISLDRMVSSPIAYPGQVFGAIAVCNRLSPYTSRDLELLKKVATHIGTILTHRGENRVVKLSQEAGPFDAMDGIIGRHPQMLRVFESIREVGKVNAPVYICGESGTGKELIAKAIHKNSDRRHGPFVPVNCSALPESLLASELFGHAKGAFSGATRDKRGRFELADGGTLFLDEIGEISHVLQVSLLRVLQEGVIEPVGGESPVRVDVRIVSATSKDLKELVKEGKIREDFYYRICVIPIDLPPLRERGADVLLIADDILRATRREMDLEPIYFSDGAREQLLKYSWPGNIRELQNAIRYACVKCTEREIAASDLPRSVFNASPVVPSARKRGRRRKLNLLRVQEALEATGGNKYQAAKKLGVCRATLYNFLNDNDMLGT